MRTRRTKRTRRTMWTRWGDAGRGKRAGNSGWRNASWKFRVRSSFRPSACTRPRGPGTFSAAPGASPAASGGAACPGVSRRQATTQAVGRSRQHAAASGLSSAPSAARGGKRAAETRFGSGYINSDFACMNGVIFKQKIPDIHRDSTYYNSIL